MFNIFDVIKGYLAYLLGSLIIASWLYIGYLKYNQNTLKTELKTQKQTILKQKKELYLLKKNNKIEIANTEIKSSTDNAIEEIKKLQEVDLNEENNKHDHVYNSSAVLDGVFLMHPSN